LGQKILLRLVSLAAPPSTSIVASFTFGGIRPADPVEDALSLGASTLLAGLERGFAAADLDADFFISTIKYQKFSREYSQRFQRNGEYMQDPICEHPEP
jgi:hypothetical protein